jgi:hypothetical protein
VAAREAPCFFAFAQLVNSRFGALFLRPSSAANQINWGQRGDNKAIRTMKTGLRGRAQLSMASLGTLKRWIASMVLLGRSIRSAVLIWWSCCPFIVWQTLVRRWIERNWLCESNFRRKSMKNGGKEHTQLELPLFLANDVFFMKDKRCHAQLFVSLYLFLFKHHHHPTFTCSRSSVARYYFKYSWTISCVDSSVTLNWPIKRLWNKRRLQEGKKDKMLVPI